jgi:hypothetical protein
MSKNTAKDTGFANVKCSVCSTEAHSKPGKTHRRCSGSSEAAPQAKYNRIPAVNRGTWQ